MSDERARRQSPERGGLSAPRTRRRVGLALRAAQGALALWLLVSPVLLAGPSLLVGLKDTVTGGVLLTVTVAAAVSPAVRRVEHLVCAVLGGLLIVASVLLEFGTGAEAAARQWNQVVVGVLLVCLGAVRAR